MRGFSRGSMFICARLSTWNTPIESAWHSMSYTAGSSGGTVPSERSRAVMLLQQREALADAGEHAEAEHIDLEQPERVEIVLVPFDEGAVLHGGVADGHDLRRAARASARSRRHAGRDGAGSRAALASARGSARAAGRSDRGRPGAHIPQAGRSCSGPRWWWRARRRCPRKGPSALPTSRTAERPR